MNVLNAILFMNRLQSRKLEYNKVLVKVNEPEMEKCDWFTVSRAWTTYPSLTLCGKLKYFDNVSFGLSVELKGHGERLIEGFP